MPKKIRDSAILDPAAGTAPGITEVRRQESLLRTGALQNAIFNSIFNSANFSSIATDAKGVIQIFNVGAERMLGYAAADVMNKITPADISDPKEVIARAKALSVELGTPITPGFEALVFKASRGIEDIYELTYIRKDGSRLPALVSVTALRDEQDAIIGYLLIGTDNTARNLARQALEETNTRLNALINSSADVIIFSLDQEYRYTAFNERHRSEMREVWNADIEIGMNLLDVMVIPEVRDLAKQSMDRALRGESFVETQHQPDQDTDYEFIWSPVRYEHGEVIGVAVFVRDVSERNRLDRMLHEQNVELERARSVAEQANRAKTDWTNRMNHELRTPLNAVIGFTGLLERERAGPLNEEQTRYVGYVKQSGEHVLALVNDVLDLAKIEAGKLDLHPEKLVVVDLLTGVVSMVSASAADKGLQLESKVFDPQLAVIADPLRLLQVVLNLVTNAIKFTQQGGVRIEAGRMGDLGLEIADPVVAERLSALPDPQSAIVIRVADTGIGIKAGDFSKVFGEFEQIDNPLSRAEEGTGLGLSLVKQLVRLHGGQVWLESEVGRGTTFYVAMPG